MNKPTICNKKCALIIMMFTIIIILSNYTTAIDVTTCGFLNTANGIYNLTTDLQINASTCITVNNTNITFNGNGYSIRGNRTIATIGISVTKANATIQNMKIINFSNSYSLTAADIKMNNINDTGYVTYGISISSSGLRAKINNFNTTGPMQLAANMIRLTNGTTTSTIYIWQSNMELTNIKATNTATTTISVNSGVTENITITNITATGAGQNVVTLSNAANFTNITIKDSKIDGTTGKAFIITRKGTIYIYNNTITYTTGEILNANINSSGINMYANNISITTGRYINDTSGKNFYNRTMNGQNTGNIYQHILNGSITVTGNITSTNYPIYYIGSTGSGYPLNNTNSQNKFLCNFTGCADYAPLTTYLTSSITNTCTYSGSGTWYIKVSDNCTLTTQTINERIIVNETGGKLTITGNVRAKNWSLTPSAFTGTFIFYIAPGGSYGLIR